MDTPRLGTLADPQDPVFQQNAKVNEALAGELRDRLAAAARGGPQRARDRHTARGKLLPRDRVDGLLDPGIAVPRAVARWPPTGCTTTRRPAPGIITGIGRVAGRECVVVANDATVKGGTYYPMTVKKHLRAQEIALENRLPCIYLVDSGGAFLPMQDEVFPDREHFGRIFYNQATMSAPRHPADRRRARLVHRRRRVRPGDERRDRDRPRPGHDLPRRPAAGEGGDRRGRHRRGAGRRRRAPAGLRGHRPPRRRRRARAARSSATSSPPSPAPAAPPWDVDRGRASPRSTRTSSTAWCPADSAHARTTCAR